METRDYTGIVPTQPPVGLIGWLKEQGKFRRHALIYKAAWVADPLSGEKERMARLKCSACGGEMYAQRVDAGGCHGSYAAAPFGYVDPVHGDPVICGYDALCPMCGAQVKVFHIGRFRDWIPLEEVYPMTVGRVEDKVVLAGWCVRHWCTTEGCEQTAALSSDEVTCSTSCFVSSSAVSTTFFSAKRARYSSVSATGVAGSGTGAFKLASI